MAVRHNLCPNPALSVNATGWAGSATPTRTAVVGFVRPWAARYTPLSFIETPRAAVVPSQVWTLSVYARVVSGFATMNINSYLSWWTAGGSSISFDSLALPALANGVIARLVRTGTAPSNAATASLVFDGLGPPFTSLDLTAMLTEQTDGADTYADGDTTGWAWDGTAGLSASSEIPVTTGLPGRITTPSATAGVIAPATARGLLGAIT